MRVTTEMWVSALSRRVYGDGGFATVARRGSSEAGAVFVLVRDRLGLMSLYGPAPQTTYDSAKPEDRRFSLIAGDADQEAIDARITKEARFDGDLWVLEIEPGATQLGDLLEITTP
ncbi:MAG: DUF1491 family protein [Rhizobiaceae bacterium]